MLLHDARRATRLVAGRRAAAARGAGSLAVGSRRRSTKGLARVDAALRAGRAGPYAHSSGDRRAACVGAERRARPTGDRSPRSTRSCSSREPQPRSSSSIMRWRSRWSTARTPGLLLMDAIAARGELRDYHLLHAARADLLRRLGRHDEALRRVRNGARARHGRARAPLSRASAQRTTIALLIDQRRRDREPDLVALRRGQRSRRSRARGRRPECQRRRGSPSETASDRAEMVVLSFGPTEPMNVERPSSTVRSSIGCEF